MIFFDVALVSHLERVFLEILISFSIKITELNTILILMKEPEMLFLSFSWV